MIKRYDAPLKSEQEYLKSQRDYERKLLKAMKQDGLIPRNGKVILNLDLVEKLINFHLPEEKSESKFEFETIRKAYEQLKMNLECLDGTEIVVDTNFIGLLHRIMDWAVFDDFLQSNLYTEPENDAMLMNRDNAYSQVEMYDKALADYAEALKLNPNQRLIYYNRARLFFKIGEYEKAIEDLSEGLKKPHCYDPELFYALRAKAFFELKKFDAVIGDLEKILAVCQEKIEQLSGKPLKDWGFPINHRLFMELGIKNAITLLKALVKEKITPSQRKQLKKLKEEIVHIRNSAMI